MTEHAAPRFRGIDDYVAMLSDEERAALEQADEKLDLALLLYRMREDRGLSQAAAAQRSGLKQQAISRLERVPANVQFNTIGRYVEALGYTASLVVKDGATGRVVGELPVAPLLGKPPAQLGRRDARAPAPASATRHAQVERAADKGKSSPKDVRS